MEMRMEKAEQNIAREYDTCKKEAEEVGYLEMETRCIKAEEKCAELNMEIQMTKSMSETLESKFKALEAEKLAIEEELKALRGEPHGECLDHGRESEGGTRRIVDLTEESVDEDEILQLRIENKVLECEKKKAEREVEVWERKFRELESRVLKFEEGSMHKGGEQAIAGRITDGSGSLNIGSHDLAARISAYQTANLNGISRLAAKLDSSLPTKEQTNGLLCVYATGDMQASGTPINRTPHVYKRREFHLDHGRRVRKHLNFEEEKFPGKEIAPFTPGVARSASRGIIDISDSDDEPNIAMSGNSRGSTDYALNDSIGGEEKIDKENTLNEMQSDQKDTEDVEAMKEDALYISTPKRKRTSNVVTSDTESENDNIPISKLRKLHLLETNPDQVGSEQTGCSIDATAPFTATSSRRRLVKGRCNRQTGQAMGNSSTQTDRRNRLRGIPTHADLEDDKSEEETSDSEGESLGGFIVNTSDGSDGDSVSGSEDLSDGNVDFEEIISKLQRKKSTGMRWDFEGDMLSDFGKDPELCMKAVCALYRQQTAEEKGYKEALFCNNRGFSKFDAPRGTALAEFLTDGDPQGDLKKSVRELQEYDPKAIELCRKLATHYSKQLFEIYKNKEDPLFLPD